MLQLVKETATFGQQSLCEIHQAAPGRLCERYESSGEGGRAANRMHKDAPWLSQGPVWCKVWLKMSSFWSLPAQHPGRALPGPLLSGPDNSSSRMLLGSKCFLEGLGWTLLGALIPKVGTSACHRTLVMALKLISKPTFGRYSTLLQFFFSQAWLVFLFRYYELLHLRSLTPACPV